MTGVQSYKDLIAWQKAMDMVEGVYRVTAGYPRDERFGLISQTRRAAVSVPSNIAEGYGRQTRREYIQFVHIARGSANEVETQLLLACRLGSCPAKLPVCPESHHRGATDIERTGKQPDPGQELVLPRAVRGLLLR